MKKLVTSLPTPIIPVILTMLALALRLNHLGYHDYWDDEIVTTLLARPALTTIYQTLSAYDIHPPLYYMLVHLWRVFGDDIVTLRLLSVVIGTLCVPALYWLGCMLINRPVGVLAALFLAVNPSHIVHSQQARMYPLVTLLIILATLLFVSAWQRGGWYRWLWCGILVAAGFYTHVYVPFSILAFNVWAAWETYQETRSSESTHINNIRRTIHAIRAPGRLRVRWIGLIGAQFLGLVAFVPFVPHMYRMVDMPVTKWLVHNGPFDWLPAFIEHSNGATLVMHTTRGQTVLDIIQTNGPGIASLVIAFVAVFATLWHNVRAVWYASDTHTQSMRVLLLALVWTPIVVATTISLTYKPLLLSRYLIGLLPPLALLMAWSVVQGWHIRKVRIIGLAFAASMLVCVTLMYASSPHRNERIATAHWLVAQQQPGDAMVHTYWHMFDTMMLTYPHLDHMYIAPGPAYTESFWQGRATYIKWHTPQHITPVAEFAPRYRRVWLALTIFDHDYAYHQQVDQGWLEANGKLVDAFDFGGTTVFLYEVHAKN